MFEQDYIMRLIKEMVRMLLKLLFNIDMEKATFDILEDNQIKIQLNKLLELVEQGKINEAENEIYEMLENGDKENIKAALYFYSYLNEKDDEFLIENDFSREEIKEGLRNIANNCGVGGVSEIFL